LEDFGSTRPEVEKEFVCEMEFVCLHSADHRSDTILNSKRGGHTFESKPRHIIILFTMSSYAIAFPLLLDSNGAVVLQPPEAVVIPPANNNRHWIDEAIAARSPNGYHLMMGTSAHHPARARVRSDGFLEVLARLYSITLHHPTASVEEAQVACDELIGDAAAAPLLHPSARPATIIHDEDEDEVEALALVDDDTWPEDNNNVIVSPERNVVRRPVEPALRPFRDFANLRRRSDHPGPPLHLTFLGTKRTSERLLARTRCFRLAPRTVSFEDSYNEWGPPSFPILVADEDSDNTSSSLTENEE
jgi:hypothetical protein